MTQLSRRAMWVACLAATVTSASGLSALDEPAPLPPVPFRMKAIALGLFGSPETMRIVIERWSSDKESRKLVDTVVENGDEKLWQVLHDIEPPAGFMDLVPIWDEDMETIEDTVPTLAWRIPYAFQTSAPGGGRRIVFTVVTATPSIDRYLDFTVGEIRLGPDGKGKGEFAFAKKVTYDAGRNELEIEYRPVTVRLNFVAVEE